LRPQTGALLEVDARFHSDRRIEPVAFMLDGLWVEVVEVGRSWWEAPPDTAYHVLVRTASGDRYQLGLSGRTLAWSIEARWPARTVA
jgi:hypothetical protein